MMSEAQTGFREFETPQEAKAQCPKCRQVFYPKIGGGREQEILQCPHCRKKIRRDELVVLE